jgi:hypothetical protein
MLENAPTARSPSADRPLTVRSRTTNKPLRGRVSGNTSAGRRVRDLYRGLMASIGNPTDTITQARALHAAELAVAVEAQRLRAARGEDVNLDALVRLSNAADRAVRRLGLRAASPAPPSGPTLSEMIELARANEAKRNGY